MNCKNKKQTYNNFIKTVASTAVFALSLAILKLTLPFKVLTLPFKVLLERHIFNRNDNVKN
ncbi:hypothetical protein CMT41_14000 [Colwellia sp. MT41]|nr:hypothetical protein CMT41_14000 [Colwellia sp. MT41]